jgi:hypothetical protein
LRRKQPEPTLKTALDKLDKLDKLDNDDRDAGQPPAMPFREMTASTDGRSAIAQKTLADFVMASVSGDAEPIWMRSRKRTTESVTFRRRADAAQSTH